MRLWRAGRAAAELGETAAAYQSAALLAAAATAAGRVQLATDDSAACATLRRAVERWGGLDVPHEVATARVLLAQACRKAGDQDGAARSIAIARELFKRVGSVDAAAAPGSALPGGLSEREAPSDGKKVRSSAARDEPGATRGTTPLLRHAMTNTTESNTQGYE